MSGIMQADAGRLPISEAAVDCIVTPGCAQEVLSLEVDSQAPERPLPSIEGHTQSPISHFTLRRPWEGADHEQGTPRQDREG